MIEKDYLIKQLKNLGDRVVLDKKWKKEQRQFLLSQLNAQLDNIEGIEISKELKVLSYFQTLLKPVVLLLVFVLGSGWLSVMASENSLPGDLLYPVKINSEKVEIALTFDKAKEAELHMEAAKKRVEEIQELKKQDVLVEAEVVQETYDRVKVSVSDAQAALQELKEDNAVVEAVIEESEALMQAANVIDEGLKEISDNLNILSEDILDEEIIGGDALVEVPEDLLIGLEDLNSDVDVIVDEMVKDTAVVESEEVKDAVSEIIERAAEEINKDTETIIHDLVEEEGEILNQVQDDSEEEVNEEDVLEEIVIEESIVTEEIIDEIVNEELLIKVDDILTSELITDGLADSKEINDLLTKEVVALLEAGEVDKALELLRKGQELTIKMQEVIVVEEESGEDLAGEIVIEEESLEEVVVLEEEIVEEKVVEELVEESVEDLVEEGEVLNQVQDDSIDDETIIEEASETIVE